MFANDRDLLALEPNVFADAAWAGQTLVEVDDGVVSGLTLSSATADFEAAGVDTGRVALVNGVALEVLERVGAGALLVSLVRAAPGDPPIPPRPTTDAAVRVSTFAPQVRVAHEEVMRALGLATEEDGAPNASHVLNPRAAVRAEALGALALVYGALAARVGEDSTHWVKARAYEERFARERNRVVVALDLDGDGEADATRRAATAQMRRG